MAITCKRCSKPAVVRAQVSSSMLGVLSDDPLCAVHEQAERATVAMQGGLTKVEFLPLDEPTAETPASTDDPIRAAIAKKVRRIRHGDYGPKDMELFHADVDGLRDAAFAVLDLADSLDADAAKAAGNSLYIRAMAQEIRDRVRKGLEG